MWSSHYFLRQTKKKKVVLCIMKAFFQFPESDCNFPEIPLLKHKIPRKYKKRSKLALPSKIKVKKEKFVSGEIFSYYLQIMSHGLTFSTLQMRKNPTFPTMVLKLRSSFKQL
jgi:hypothetical protein